MKDKMMDIAKKKLKINTAEVDSTKATSTAFILMFPTVLLTLIAVVSASDLLLSAFAIGLSIYQFLLIKKFIEDYYRK